MRSRDTIEESFKELVVPSGSTDSYKLLFELLLDIRGILMEQRNNDLRSKIEEAREKVEEERAKKIEETSERIGGE